MDAHSLEIWDENDSDVILRIICSDGVEYEGNPVHLHSHVLNKSKFFQARLSKRWSLHIPPPEIKLTLPPNGVAENYIKCIRLMYSSYKGTGLYFSGIDEALNIIPVAFDLLFEEAIEACMQYLEAVPWTPQQTLKIRSLLSSLQISVSTDLSARLRISSLGGELGLLKRTLQKMFSTISGNKSNMIPVKRMRHTIEEHLSGIFQGSASPAVEEVCRDTIINEFRFKIECIKNHENPTKALDSACEYLLWLLDVAKLCNIRIFEATLKMFVEDSQLPDILFQEIFSNNTKFSIFSNDTLFTEYLLQILVDRCMKCLANGDIIVAKSFRISFLRMWVPVMAYHICKMGSFYKTLSGQSLAYSEIFVERVTKVVGTLPLDDQKVLFMFWTNSLQAFPYQLKGTFQWWIDAILLALKVTSVNNTFLALGDE